MKVGHDFYSHEDVVIKHPSLCSFGNHAAIDKGVYCTTALNVGDYVHLAPYVVIIGGPDSKLTMGHFSGISAGCKIVCGGDNYSSGHLMNPQVPIEFREPKISHNIFEPFSCVGVNTTVMPGIVLAEGSVVGANSVLTKDTEPWTIYLGSPAKPYKTRPYELAYKYANMLGYNYNV